MGPYLGCSGAVWTPVSASFRVRVPGLRGCCAGLNRGLCLTLPSLDTYAKLGSGFPDPPYSPDPEVPKRAARGSPAHCQHAAPAAPPPVAACLSLSCLEVRTQPL